MLASIALPPRLRISNPAAATIRLLTKTGDRRELTARPPRAPLANSKLTHNLRVQIDTEPRFHRDCNKSFFIQWKVLQSQVVVYGRFGHAIFLVKGVRKDCVQM